MLANVPCKPPPHLPWSPWGETTQRCVSLPKVDRGIEGLGIIVNINLNLTLEVFLKKEIFNQPSLPEGKFTTKHNCKLNATFCVVKHFIVNVSNIEMM
jgi:hypothetical protein